MTKKLYRSRTDKMVAGVCGGLAAHFNIDPVIVRLLFVLLLFSGVFPGVVLYVVLWVIVPQEPEGSGNFQ